jgi:hypothetical protein
MGWRLSVLNRIGDRRFKLRRYAIYGAIRMTYDGPLSFSTVGGTSPTSRTKRSRNFRKKHGLANERLENDRLRKGELNRLNSLPTQSLD